MESASDALKIAFAVMVFVMALGVAIGMFSQLNQVSKVILSSSDITKFYDYNLKAEEQSKNRIVGIETIAPTLYKYSRENYTVVFLQKNGKPLELFPSVHPPTEWKENAETGQPKVGVIGKYYTANSSQYATYDKKYVCSFDIDEETDRDEPWLADQLDIKEHLDYFLFGGKYTYPNGTGNSYDFQEGFVQKYQSNTFKEFLGEYTYDIKTTDEGQVSENPLLKKKKKRVLIYQLQ